MIEAKKSFFKLFFTFFLSEEFLLGAFLLLLPFQTRLFLWQGRLNDGYFEYGTLAFYAVDAVIIFGAFAGSRKFSSDIKGFHIKENIFSRRLLSFFFEKFKKPTFLFSLLFITALGVIHSIFAAFDVLVAWYGIMTITFGALFFYRISPIRNIVWAAWALVISSVIQALLGISQFFLQEVAENKWLGMAGQKAEILGASVIEYADERWLRAYGALPHPNMLGGFLSVGIFFAVALYMSEERGFRKVFALICAMLVSLGLWVSFSRSAWVAASVSFTFLWIMILIRFREKRADLLKVSVAILATLGLGMSLAPQLFMTRIQGDARLEEKSLAMRRAYERQARKVFASHPWFGVGFHNEPLAVHAVVYQGGKAYEYQPVHNVYMLFLSEFGLLGLGILIWMTASFWHSRLKCWYAVVFGKVNASGSMESFWNIIGMILLPHIVILGIFDHYLYTSRFGSLLLLFLFFFMHHAFHRLSFDAFSKI